MAADLPDIRVLVVDDEAIAAAAHSAYVERLDGFTVAATAHDGQGALHALKDAAEAGTPVDLVLLDMNLPDLHGLDVSRRIRSAGFAVDIIAITAVRELAIVRGAISAGIVQYLIKPFTFATFADKLSGYLEFRRHLAEQASQASQSGVDQAFASLRTPTDLPLPKGLSAPTLAAVTEFVRHQPGAVSATELVDPLGVSRVTARRYLEHLADTGTVLRSARYGTPGRPENEYRWNR
ncbi:chemotaxis protein CheY [Arthrobacter sp. ERGS1:01]|uniref:response regulator n=1 Tax=Arthrobacter sp. ERGS1:01 TaxID=1704044 RepID=UPI0006B43CC4|nr:response regulator [Arthrobacter sp. ERGS1:01]ALE05427.1 chemotaxis protein CheY [Arthrobacter sp. ERGS1:01]